MELHQIQSVVVGLLVAVVATAILQKFFEVRERRVSLEKIQTLEKELVMAKAMLSNKNRTILASKINSKNTDKGDLLNDTFDNQDELQL